jgi:hypothetical protein
MAAFVENAQLASLVYGVDALGTDFNEENFLAFTRMQDRLRNFSQTNALNASDEAARLAALGYVTDRLNKMGRYYDENDEQWPENG